jgi:hypothetical protein
VTAGPAVLAQIRDRLITKAEQHHPRRAVPSQQRQRDLFPSGREQSSLLRAHVSRSWPAMTTWSPAPNAEFLRTRWRTSQRGRSGAATTIPLSALKVVIARASFRLPRDVGG